MSKSFKDLRLEQELKKLSDKELESALLNGMQEGRECKDEEEWKVIRDTLIVIHKEIERRKG